MSVLNFILLANLIFDLGCCDRMKRNEYETKNSSANFQTDYKARIVGGKQSNLEERRYQVLIKCPQDNGMFTKCSGTIIAAKWVLTASHCYKEGSTGTILVYTLPLDLWNSIPVKKAHRFPRPSGTRKYFDYMLLELVKDLTYGKTVNFIATAQSASSIIAGKYGTVAGWGSTKFGRPYRSTVLLEVNLPILKQELCEKISRNLNINEFCLSDPDRRKNTAPGDSGSGFVVDGELLGVVARVSQVFTVVTSVPYIRSWICEKTGICHKDLLENANESIVNSTVEKLK